MRGVAAGLIVALAIGTLAWLVVSTYLGPLLRELLRP
jgi:hypothetical protein